MSILFDETINLNLQFQNKQQDAIYFWARPHPAGAYASGDGLGKPTGWDWTQVKLLSVLCISHDLFNDGHRTRCGPQYSQLLQPL